MNLSDLHIPAGASSLVTFSRTGRTGRQRIGPISPQQALPAADTIFRMKSGLKNAAQTWSVAVSLGGCAGLEIGGDTKDIEGNPISISVIHILEIRCLTGQISWTFDTRLKGTLYPGDDIRLSSAVGYPNIVFSALNITADVDASSFELLCIGQ